MNSHASAVADHGDVWQPSDQLRLRNLAVSVRDVVGMKARGWLTNPLQEIRADNPDRLRHEFLTETKFGPVEVSIQPIHRFEQATEFRVLRRESRQPFADWFAFPPSFFAQRRESITIESRSDVVRC